MISPMLRRSAMPAKQVRVLLTVFFVRHVLGVLAFGWMTYTAYTIRLTFWWFMVGFGLLYAGSVVYNGRKLVRQYRHRLAVEQGLAAVAPMCKTGGQKRPSGWSMWTGNRRKVAKQYARGNCFNRGRNT